MADSTPLLSQSNSSNSAPPPPPLHDDDQHQHQHLPSLNSTIEKCTGELNWTQFLLSVLVSFSWFFDGQQTFITVFTDALPPWHCTDVDGDFCISATATTTSNMCNLPRDSWAWDGPTRASIISEWNLQCESSFITGFPASSFFIGCLIGGLVLATLADSSIGRKNTLLVTCFLMSFSSFLASFSTNIWTYSVLKFLSGFGRASIGTAALVLATELVGKHWRGQVGAVGFFCFTIGFLSLPAMAYANRNSSWRNLYLWTSLPAIFYCLLIHLFVPESPRWLLVRGRKEKAVEILKRISSTTQSNFNLAISTVSLEEEDEPQNVDLFSALKILTSKKWSTRRLLTITAMGFGIGLVYYGMPLGLEVLSFNLYFSVTFNALSEIPSTLLTFILLEKFNRRSIILVLSILSGVCSVLSTMNGKLWTKFQIVFELISFCSACTAYDISLIYSTELFPTCVRNSALSLTRQAMVFGGVVSPLLVAASRGHNNNFLSYGVFGLVIGCCGVFGVCLPETKGKAFSDTMEEEENKLTESCNAFA